ncbi:ribosomal protein 60S [Tuber magnatum]|uniref:Large ribosomal subunit protein P1 n=1 Tax=Tuber magnatum TaxID=42249 RepID=A0A317SH34_9PEZI|nr:ribosomal protein 60S [Tuber magnatum]
MSNSELAVSYAALILADDGLEVTSDKLQALIKASGNNEVEPIWCSLFAKALEGKDVKDLLLNVGSGGGAAAAPGGAVTASGGAGGAAEEKEPEKEEEKEESDEDMGFGLFD